MATEWMDYLAKWRKDHPDVKGKMVMQRAGEEYRKAKGTKGSVSVSRAQKGKADVKDFSTKKGTLLKTGKDKGKKAFSKDK
tara:strand:- start:244 stop:486 length:243 start_codon:yes stop_codon:yes gene_type:complete